MSKALVVVDVQRDFCEGGSLAVEGGKQAAKDIDRLISESKISGKAYAFYLATKDFHNPNSDNHGHISDNPDYVNTWPAHCVSSGSGSFFQSPLTSYLFDDVFKKGRGIPAYSGFQGVGVVEKMSLEEYLRSNGVDEIDVCGIALDYCVKATCLDGIKLGFKVNLLKDYSPAIHDPLVTLQALDTAGVTVV